MFCFFDITSKNNVFNGDTLQFFAGGEALVSCGMMESLLKVVNWRSTEPEHITVCYWFYLRFYFDSWNFVNTVFTYIFAPCSLSLEL